MNDPKIPDNSLTDRIRTIIKLTEDMGEGAFEFDAPISEKRNCVMGKGKWYKYNPNLIRIGLDSQKVPQ